jgi:hypothetical protein
VTSQRCLASYLREQVALRPTGPDQFRDWVNHRKPPESCSSNPHREALGIPQRPRRGFCRPAHQGLLLASRCRDRAGAPEAPHWSTSSARAGSGFVWGGWRPCRRTGGSVRLTTPVARNVAAGPPRTGSRPRTARCARSTTSSRRCC